MEHINNENQILKSMTTFLSQNNDNSIPVISLYNKWSTWSHIVIDDDILMEKCLHIFMQLKNTNKDFINETL